MYVNPVTSAVPTPAAAAEAPARRPGERMAAWLAAHRMALLLILGGYAVFFAPYLLLGQDAYVEIHDHLDSVLVYLRLLAESGTTFSYGQDAVIPQVMNGLPRSALSSGLGVPAVLFTLFDPFTAYVVNRVLVAAVAFAGMFLLLRRFVLPADGGRNVALAVAFVFSVLPFYATGFGVSVAGQPLLLYAFLSIAAREDRWWHWLVIGLFPFYSSLVGVGPFFGALLFVVWVHGWVRKGRPDLRFAAAVALWVVVYVVVEAPLLASMFLSPDFQSHRAEFRLSELTPGSLVGMVRQFIYTGVYGHHHAATFLTLPIALTGALALVVGGHRPAQRRLLLVLAAAVTAVLAFLVLYRPVVVGRLGGALPVLNAVQFDRFYLLLPLLWFLFFGVSLAILLAHPRYRRLVPAAVVLQGVAVLATNHEFRLNLRSLAGDIEPPSYREFFASGLFRQIEGHIGRPRSAYRVVSVGLHPSIAQYNGFYTLDGYLYNYPLEYKHAWGRVIGQELAEDRALWKYFNYWGSSAYVFSSELGSQLDHRPAVDKIRDLDVDVAQLRRMGASYLISAVPIGNAAELGLGLERAFGGADDYWTLYLYRIPGEPPARAVAGSFGGAGRGARG
jgi:hypothetical protein